MSPYQDSMATLNINTLNMNDILDSEDVLVNIGLITASMYMYMYMYMYMWLRDATARGQV